MKTVKRVNLKGSHHKKKNFFLVYLKISIWDDGCSLNILWSSFDDVSKLSYVVLLRLTQHCMPIISIKLKIYVSHLTFKNKKYILIMNDNVGAWRGYIIVEII